ncbi:MAG: calcium-binding protein [Bacteroidota bacterium]
MSLKIGDNVIVKSGIIDPDSETFEMGGWQGRVTAIIPESDNSNNIITIEWDSLTLKQIPAEYIHQSEVEGLDWKTMNLYETDLEKSIPRDKQKDVKMIQDLLSKKYYWSSLGEEGLRIAKILEGVNPKDEMKCLQNWVSHLDKTLTFPIQAIVTESEDNWLIKDGDKVRIESLTEIVDLYGIIAGINLKGKELQFPLCDLEVIDKKSSNFQLIEDYRTWFANR